MPFNLPRIAREQGLRRPVALRPIIPTQAMATDLAAIYAPAWQVWRDHSAAIMAAYDPKPLTDGLTTDSPEQAQTEIDSAARDFLSRLLVEITPALRRWVVRAERIHRDKWAAAVEAGTGIDLSTLLTAGEVSETVEAFVARNVALVRNVSDQAQSRISDAVFRGYQNRTPAREVAKEVREATGMARARSIRIAADQNSKLSSALDRERREEAGLTKYKYRHSGKLHPRQNHKARDGFVYVAKTGESTNGGPKIPTDDRASMAPYCGCREQAYIDLLDEID
ncbi:phage minor head protein [Rhizorhabdus histidinilytica]|uniref:phage minor head protein n=1 Tax=Rhizorhabdus histidinilytica TaxID=439228 RepID=UPI003220320E